MNLYHPKFWLPFYSTFQQFRSGLLTASELLIAVIFNISLFVGFGWWGTDKSYFTEVFIFNTLMALGVNFLEETTRAEKRKLGRIIYASAGIIFLSTLIYRWVVSGYIVHLVSVVFGFLYFSIRIVREVSNKPSARME